jgi:hypothetical protein
MKELVGLLQEEFYEQRLPALVTRDARVPQVEKKIIAVVGMRRAGKTYFLYQQIAELLKAGEPRDSILFLSFEDDRLIPVDRAKLAGLIEALYALHPENHHRRVHLFLDEIQNVEGWPPVLRRFLDTRDIRIFVSGSSAKLLSREIATALRGRSLPCEISPFSFKERLRFLGAEVPAPGASLGPAARDRLLQHLRTHLHDGGFPETLPQQPVDRLQTLRDYVDVVILRDIIERHGITNVALVRYLIRTLLSIAGGRFTVNKCFNDLKSQGFRVAKNTLHEYLEYIEDAFLAFLVPLAARSVRRKQVNPRKVYAVDPGLVQAFTLRTENYGPLFENLVFNDLRRRGCDVAYHLTSEGNEVDFVAQYPDGRTRLYQVCFDPSDEATRRREERALEEAKKELGVDGSLVTPESYYQEFVLELHEPSGS